MLIAAISQPTPTPPAKIDISLSDAAIILSLVTALLGGLFGVIRITTAIAEIKSEFEKKDLQVMSRLEALAIRIESGFSGIQKDTDKLEMRVNLLHGQLMDMQRYLAKNGYEPRSTPDTY